MVKKIYITTGTYDYLWRLFQRHKKRSLIFMHNHEHALLLDETVKQSIFQLPSTYEMIAEGGELVNKGFAHFYYYPVLEEEREFFEHHILKANIFGPFPRGLIAYRFLRPVKKHAYLFFTLWEKEVDFRLWKKDLSLPVLLEIPESKLKKVPEPFPVPAYGVSYQVGKKEEE